MRLLKIAIWTSGEPVSLSCTPASFMVFCFFVRVSMWRYSITLKYILQGLRYRNKGAPAPAKDTGARWATVERPPGRTVRGATRLLKDWALGQGTHVVVNHAQSEEGAPQPEQKICELFHEGIPCVCFAVAGMRRAITQLFSL